MLRARATITDDAGVQRDAVRLQTLFGDERNSDPDFSQLLQRVHRTRLATGSKALLILSSLAAVLLAGVIRICWPSTSILVSSLIAVALGSALAFPFAFLRQGRAAKKVGDVLLREGICPCCAYNLGDQLEREGSLLCPECGARWGAARILRRHTFSAVEAEPQPRRWWRQFGEFDISGPTRIRDDRSWTRPIVHARLRGPLREAKGERRSRLLEARSEMIRNGHVARTIVAVFFAIVLGVGSVPLLLRPFGLDTLLGAFGALMAILVTASWIRGAQGVRMADVRHAMLRRRLCPCCAGDLEDAEADDEGLTPCPECGAAWRLAGWPKYP